MKIAQISDIHIGPDDSPVRGINVRDNFLRLLELAKTYDYDVLVLSGDLCYQDPVAKTYEWICQVLAERVTQPVYVIPGNHDNSIMMGHFFKYPLTQRELYYSVKLNDIECIFLDSSKGVLSPDQKKWLELSLAEIDSNPIFIFIHHPPLLGLVPHMDGRHALQDRNEIMEILTSTTKQVHVFCGHYHVDKVIQKQNVLVHITPSGFIQIDQRHEAFEIDHNRSGFRLIEIQGEVVYSQVAWLE